MILTRQFTFHATCREIRDMFQQTTHYTSRSCKHQHCDSDFVLAFCTVYHIFSKPGYLSRYCGSLRDGRLGEWIPVRARFSAPVQTGPHGAHPASCTMYRRLGGRTAVPIRPWNSIVRNRPWTSTSIQDLFHPNSWQTPVAAVTVYSAPDDGHKGRPKHVEHTCSF